MTDREYNHRNQPRNKCFTNVLVGNNFDIAVVVLALRNLQETNQGYKNINVKIRQVSEENFAIDVEFLV